MRRFPVAAEAAYVRKYAGKATRDRITEMIGFIKAALSETVQNSAKIDEITKTAAIHKLTALEWEIGGPDVLYNVHKVDNYSDYAKVLVNP